MSREKNFLLGQGERLTTKVLVPTGGGDKNPPYDFSNAKKRIHNRLDTVVNNIKILPEEACPSNEVVALVTMHPRYLSKSDFPEELFKSVGLRSIGSRSTLIKPEKWGLKNPPEDEVITEQVFVAGTRDSFSKWNSEIQSWGENNTAARQITRIEDISLFKATDKIKSIPQDKDEAILEVVIHNSGDKSILEAFESYAKKMNSEPVMARSRNVQGLTFIPVKAPVKNILHLADFSFLRVVRGMPSLRPIPTQILRSNNGFELILPDERPVSSDVKVVIFDGGVPAGMNLERYVTPIDPPGIGQAHPDYLLHGLGVTSALLFGHIENQVVERPFCHVDHVRVLDKNTSDFELDDVLNRILNHLDENPGKYHFANLSLGPQMAVNDDEVTAWTASIDERLSKIDTLMTVAVGNEGHLDAISGQNRVQPPSDGVNVLAIGACDQPNGDSWKKASYSCVGPGRRPGVVKPDGVTFGGTDHIPFMILAPSTVPMSYPIQGTSFASPLALRTAVGVKAFLGNNISSRLIQALMIHRAEPLSHSIREVGWGKFETNIQKLITCDDDETLVIYQDELPIGQHLRAPIPIPKEANLKGKVTITATLVIAPEVDPEHPGAYTRHGLEVSFRPHSGNYSETDGRKSAHPKTKSFFSVKNIYGKSEYEFREDGHKWEPCFRNSQKFLSKSLHEPCFDIYYHHREGASTAKNPRPIPYSLVISVKVPQAPDFYNQVIRAYSNILIPLRPQLQIPIRI